ncbi:aminotransferase class I/II-fold pyridoxal phosphate-dependent enzyme [soil metagenome]
MMSRFFVMFPFDSATDRGYKGEPNLMPRIYLSPPHMGPEERNLLLDAFDSNWVAPLGPHVDGFEREFGEYVHVPNTCALSSGTAGLHLALIMLGVGRDDEVMTSSLTFAATANAITYVGARPTFIDCERTSWNMDPALLAQALEDRAKQNKLPKAVIVVDLYGQCADFDPILAACARHGVPVIEDAAEGLGATYKGKNAGSFGEMAVFSFNGNKIITTGGGGMLVSFAKEHTDKARFLATQARDPAPHYQHSHVGYNYRLSNLLAAVGRGQLRVLEERIGQRRANNSYYREALADLPGLAFQSEAPWGRATFWLTCITIDPAVAKIDREKVRLALAAKDIEARPVWKPMHLQPIFAECPKAGGAVSEELFERGLCLPSGSALTQSEREEVSSIVRGAFA